MIFTIQLSIDETCNINLANINIPEDERENAEDAFRCEVRYNDMII